jgi:glycosyltransferase involved in cell wall biosynthesis
MNSPPFRILALMGGVVLMGQERGNIEALAALRREGADILCVTRKLKGAVAVPEALRARGFKTVAAHYLEHRGPGRLFAFLIRNPISFIRGNIELLKIARAFRPTHLHGPNQMYVWSFLLALLIIRAPLVFRAGDEPTIHNIFWKICWKFTVWRTTTFVANSQFVSILLQNNGVPRKSIVVIYNKPPERNLAQERRPNDLPCPPARLIAFVGELAPHKGVDILLEAFKINARCYSDIHLALAGPISDWKGHAWARELRDRALDDPDLGPRIHFMGHVDDVPDLLERSTCLVAPFLRDASPNIVMEAKASGRPVVGFALGGVPELIEHGVDGLICSGIEAGALAASIAAYLEDPALAIRHGVARAKSAG